MVGQFKIFTPAGAALTILEVQPLLFPGGNFSLSVAWGNFTTGFFLSFISLGILIYLIIKVNRGEADKTLFTIWSLVILAATLGQRRFSYYFAVNVALLTGYLSWLVLEFAGFKEPATAAITTPTEIPKKAKRKKKRRDSSLRKTSPVYMALGVIVIFFLVFFPNFGGAVNTASRAAFAPSDAWCESLSWLKENTADPFGDAAFYYGLYEPPPPGEEYNYPKSAYSVMSWWDYGHWITRIAHRIPISNPFQQGAPDAARFFIAQDESSANQIMKDLVSKYVIIDYAMPTTKFYAMPQWAGSSEQNFYDVYYQPQEGKLRPVILCHPEYYRSLVVRLYNFDAISVIPQSSTVISYEERISREGEPYKEITGYKSFSSYKEAQVYISKQKSGNWKIVGTDPFASPVPLEALEHYRLVYSSHNSVTQPNIGRISEVKIFEYVK
jgi:dolichyl-diphosphooligosaccharide--protein glycosyltransferase